MLGRRQATSPALAQVPSESRVRHLQVGAESCNTGLQQAWWQTQLPHIRLCCAMAVWFVVCWTVM